DDGLRVSRSRPPASLFEKCLRTALLACVYSSERFGFVFRAGSGRPHSVTSTARANSVAGNSSSNLSKGLAAPRVINLQPIFPDIADRFRELLEVDRFDDVTVGAHLVSAHDVALLGR